MRQNIKDMFHAVHEHTPAKYTDCMYFSHIPDVHGDIEREVILTRFNRKTGQEYDVKVMLMASYTPGETEWDDSPGYDATLELRVWHARNKMWHEIQLTNAEELQLTDMLIRDYEDCTGSLRGGEKYELSKE